MTAAFASLTALFLLSCPSPLSSTSSVSANGAKGALTVSFSTPSSRTVVASSNDFAAAISSMAIAIVNGSGATVDEATGITYGAGVVKTFGSLPPGTYTVRVNAYSAASALIATGSNSVTIAANINQNVTVNLAYSQTASSGGLSLALSWPVSTGLGYVYAVVDGAAIAVPTVTADATNYAATLTASNLAGGAHLLKIYFKTSAGSTTSIGPFVETVNIWDGVTSCCWIDSNGNSATARTFAAAEFAGSNADLAGLTFTGAALTSAFAAGTTGYTLSGISAATFSFAAASVSGSQNVACTWNGAPQTWNSVGSTTFTSPNLAWIAGTNTLQITVTAADRQTTKTYTATFVMVGAANLATALAADLAGSFMLTGDVDTTGGGNWTPIGSTATPFTGTFAGNGHSVKLASSSTASNLGLFGVIGSAGTVKDLTIIATLTSCGAASGTLAGSNMGIVDNCSSSGALTDSAGAWNIGGLVGLNSGTLRNCHSSVVVTSNGNWYAGGLAGENTGIIEHCYATGAVTGGYAGGGGLVGHNNGAAASISESFASGHVEGCASTGGLVGQHEGGASILNCYASGSVTAPAYPWWYIGGLVGIQGASATTITKSYAYGTITSSGSTKGGLLGLYSAGSVNDCFYNTDIITTGVMGNRQNNSGIENRGHIYGSRLGLHDHLGYRRGEKQRIPHTALPSGPYRRLPMIRQDGKNMTGNEPKTKHIKYPLVVKLIGIISAIVVISMAAITGFSSYFFSEDSRARAEENNLAMSQVLAAQVENKTQSVLSSALSLFDVIRESAGSRALERSADRQLLRPQRGGRLPRGAGQKRNLQREVLQGERA